jgi:DNA polymerase III epsilon subunit-like protein
METMNSYVSIDIETTGLSPHRHQVIEFGAVLEDWLTPVEQLPAFHAYVIHDEYRGDPFALAMNHEILRRIANKDKHAEFKFYRPLQLAMEFEKWLAGHKIDPQRVPVAGKNFAGFDAQFLAELRDYDGPTFGQCIKFAHRVIDPGTLYFDPRIDKLPPSTKTCMERAGIPGEVAHTAVEDAVAVIKMIRHYYAVKYGREATQRPRQPELLEFGGQSRP